MNVLPVELYREGGTSKPGSRVGIVVQRTAIAVTLEDLVSLGARWTRRA
jgi:hypothetical protein